MKSKIFIFLLLSMFLFIFPMVSATTLGTFKNGDCVNLIQTCANCSYVNVSSIIYPNSSVALSNAEMSKAGTYYSYSFCDTDLNGIYLVTGFGDPDASTETWTYDFEITYTGDKITNEQTWIYITALIFLVFFAIGILFFRSRLPEDDRRSNSGEIIQIDFLKHIRPILMIMVWAIGLAILFIIGNMGYAFLPNAMVGKLFMALFSICGWLSVVAIPVYFIFIVKRFFEDREFQRYIERGVDIGNM